MALKHVVFIKFKETVKDEDIKKLEESLGSLPSVIPEIKQYEFGRDVVHSERSYDFALVSEFDDIDALKQYQVHPEHQKVLALVKELASNVLAVDFFKK